MFNLNNQTNQNNLSAILKEKVSEIFYEEWVKISLKKKPISDEIIKYLKQNWKLIKTKLSLYYFCEQEKTLYQYWKSDFETFIHDKSWVNPTESIFKFVLKEIELETIKNWKEVEIKQFSFYDEKNNIIYLYNNDYEIIRISESSIKSIYNWDEGIMFLKNENYESWKFIEDVKREDYLNNFINSINFKDDALSIEEQRKLLKWYFYSLFFWNYFEAKPILILFWKRRSWKSFILQHILNLFYGRNVTISPIQRKEADLNASLVSNLFCFYDNLDTRVSEIVVDTLCSVATRSSIKTRKLYSDGEEISKIADCFLWFTCREFVLDREDILDRSIILTLGERKENSLSEEKFDKNKVMSELCFDLQDILKRKNKWINHSFGFRMTKFGNFFLNISDDIEKSKLILNRVLESHKRVDIDRDVIWFILGALLEDWDNAKKYNFEASKRYKAIELHSIMSKYAEDNNIDYDIDSVKMLSSKIKYEALYYESEYNIKISKSSWQSWYMFYSVKLAN